MNKLWSVLIIALLVCSACDLGINFQKFNWKIFVSDEGRFQATFPDTPEISLKESDWNNQKVTTTNFEVSSYSYFRVDYTDYPNSVAQNADLKYVYDFQRDAALKITKAELLSERDVWTGNHLGREIVAKRSALFNNISRIDTYRIYLVENRSYQVTTSIFSSAMKNAEIVQSVNKFLDSFQIIEKQH